MQPYSCQEIIYKSHVKENRISHICSEFSRKEIHDNSGDIYGQVCLMAS